MLLLETLSQPDFDARMDDGRLSIALVGMSNHGKSHWADILAREAGFDKVCVDDEVEAELAPILRRGGYPAGIQGVAEWMMQPYEQGSPERQQKYLDIEKRVMDRTIRRLADPSLDRNTVIDTTGSVVHTGNRIARNLAKHATIVYIVTNEAKRQEAFDKYMAEPKPVVWDGIYTRKKGETQDEALARSYLELLNYRSKLYADMAHVSIEYDVLYAMTSASEFLTYVRDELPKGYLHSASYVPSRQF